MRVGSDVRPRLVEAAIELFAQRGFYGVTYLDLAKRAKTTSPTIFRIFKVKDQVFEAALDKASERFPDAAKFMYSVYQKRKTGQPVEDAVTAAVLDWYAQLSPEVARLLQQAHFSNNKKWEEKGYLPLYKIIDALAAVLEAELPKDSNQTSGIRVAAAALIFALFQFKIAQTSSATSPEDDSYMPGDDDIARFVRQSLLNLPAAA